MDKLTGLTLERRRHTAAFTGCATRAVSAVCLCALAFLLSACASPQPIAFNEGLRQELLQMQDADQRIRRGKCVCMYFRKFALKNGPCRHMLALRWRASYAALQTYRASTWYNRLLGRNPSS